MNLIQIARETIKITQEESYQVDGRTIAFPKANYDNVLVILTELVPSKFAMQTPIRRRAVWRIPWS